MFDSTFVADPYPAYHHLLTTGRMHWLDTLGGIWLVPHYEDVAALLRDPRLLNGRAAGLIQHLTPEEQAQLQDFVRFADAGLAFMDGQPHLRLRRLVGQAFTPRTIEALRPRVQRITDELLDATLAEARDGQLDLLHALAHPLPVLVIAEMLGVPRAMHAQFMRWSNDIAAFFGAPGLPFAVASQAQAGLAGMRECFREIIAARRDDPRDDLISLLIQVEEQGDVLDESELLSQCTLFLTAGHETTRNLIGNGLRALMEHPEQLTQLRNDPALLPGAVVEMARYDSPIQLITRVVGEAFSYGDVQMQPGQLVGLLLGAANRDPERFPAPDRFDIARRGSRLLSFGIGPHICIGMGLAYLETEVAVGTLLRRLPHLRLAATPEQGDNFALRGLRTLPIRFTPEALTV